MKIEPFELERWMARYELRVQYDIAESGILPFTVDELLALEPPDEREATLRRLLSLKLGYGEGPGSLPLRSAVAATYAHRGPDEILVTTGAIEANFLLFNTLLDRGDHVVAPFPAYQQLYSVPRAIGCDVSLWHIRAETGFRYDVDDLERLVRPQTRLIVINSPHNPTGALLSAHDLRRVVDIADSIGAWVLSDEAYRWLAIPGGEPPAPPLADLGSRAISVGTLSKPLGLPGLRIGWLAAPEDVVAACWGMRDYVSITAGKLDDALATLALTHLDQIVARNAAILAANLACTQTWIDRHTARVSWIPPRAGLLALLHVHLDVPSHELARRLAEDYGVMLAPGAVFGYEHYLRLGLGQEPGLFAAALERVAACLAGMAGE